MEIDLDILEKISRRVTGRSKPSADIILSLITRIRQAESERDALQKRIDGGIKLCYATNASGEINRAYKSKSHKPDAILIIDN